MNETPVLYKVLVDGRSCHGGNADWFLPQGKRPGKWMPPVAGPLGCPAADGVRRGYFAADEARLIRWLKPACAVYECELRGDVRDLGDKFVGRQARLLSLVGVFTPTIDRLLACDIAEDVLPDFERLCPGDTRLRDCIATARRYVAGEATDAELRAAELMAASAERAVWSVAWGMAGAPGGAAWRSASAAWVTVSAARAARGTWSVESMAWRAARGAKRAAESRYGALLLERLRGDAL